MSFLSLPTVLFSRILKLSINNLRGQRRPMPLDPKSVLATDPPPTRQSRIDWIGFDWTGFLYAAIGLLCVPVVSSTRFTPR